MITAQSIGAQTSLSGVLKDAADSTEMIGAGIAVRSLPDSAMIKQDVTDENGQFSFTGLKAGKYLIEATFIGYKRMVKPVSFPGDAAKPMILYIAHEARMLNDIEIVDRNNLVAIKKDTVEMKSAAFKVNPDATAEDLVTKMPGIRMEDGKVTAQGEEVKKVLVDGKPFFGKSPSTTLRNLPADAVDRVQVFDAQSDRAQMTGTDDGQTEKTINIVFKPDRRTGNFGRLYAGMATDGKYKAGGVWNTFKNDFRLTLLAMSNDVNEQNFDTDDMAAMATQGGGRGGFRNRMSNPLMGNNQSGIVKSHAAGINLTDKWGKKISFTGSVFGSKTGNELVSNTYRQYYNNLLYTEDYKSNNNSYNGRASTRIEYKIDSTSQLNYTGNFNYNNYELIANTYGVQSELSKALNKNTIFNSNTGSTLSTDNQLDYMKGLGKKGRSIFIQLEQQFSNNLPLVLQDQTTEYLDTFTMSKIDNQEIRSSNYNRSYNADIDYSEPLDSFNNIGISYEIQYNDNDINKEAYQVLDNNGEVSKEFITTLSNITDNNYIAHSPSLMYRFNKNDFRLFARAMYQHAELNATQVFPYAVDIKRTYNNFLPMVGIRYNKQKRYHAGLFFRGSTNVPSISQLQDVIDNSNNLNITTGNPDLNQSTQYMMFLRFNKTNPKNYTSFSFGGRSFLTENYITDRIILLNRDTTIAGYGTLPAGVQFSYPINLNGFVSASFNADYSFPFSAIKSNVSVNGEIGYTRAPGMINSTVNYSQTYNYGCGVTISSNFSQNIDFTLYSRPRYNTVVNEINPGANNAYFTLLSGAKFNFILWNKLVINTDLSHYFNDGLADAVNANYLLWNAGVGYKFMKKNAAEVRLVAFDILKNNKAISRAYKDTYFEDVSSNVLTQYFMLVLSYKIG
jgi:hypothetical protein